MALPPPSIKIHATDINQHFVQGVATLAEKNKWPISTTTMSAQKLDFPDNLFTHSFTSFAFHCLGDHDAAAKQVYRTLQPGGTCHRVHLDLHAARRRPSACSLARAWSRRADAHAVATGGFREADLRKALVAGGFQPDNTTCSNKACYLSVPDLQRWAQLDWSYLGSLPNGWSQDDENKWHEAVNDIVEQLKSGDGISKNNRGETDENGCVCCCRHKVST